MKPTRRPKQATLQGTTKDKISEKASDGMERDGYRGSSLLCRRSKGQLETEKHNTEWELLFGNTTAPIRVKKNSDCIISLA